MHLLNDIENSRNFRTANYQDEFLRELDFDYFLITKMSTELNNQLRSNTDSPIEDPIFYSFPFSTAIDKPNRTENDTVESSELEIPGANELNIIGKIILAIVMGIIIVGTIGGNVLVVISVVKFRRLKKQVCFHFMASLALSDILVAALVMTVSVYYIMAGNWPFGWVLCRFDSDFLF